MDRFIALTAAGLAQGAIFALIALGFLLIYKATGVINFAQGDLVTLGAYLGVFGVSDLGLPPLAAYPIVLVVMFTVGAALERVAVAPLRGSSIHVMLISTMGAGLAIRAGLGIWLGSQPQRLESPFQGKTVTILGGVISMQRVVIVVATAVVVVQPRPMLSSTAAAAPGCPSICPKAARSARRPNTIAVARKASRKPRMPR